jgi:hypothetical protein
MLSLEDDDATPRGDAGKATHEADNSATDAHDQREKERGLCAWI